MSEYEQIISCVHKDQFPIHIDGCIDSQKSHFMSALAKDMKELDLQNVNFKIYSCAAKKKSWRKQKEREVQSEFNWTCIQMEITYKMKTKIRDNR